MSSISIMKIREDYRKYIDEHRDKMEQAKKELLDDIKHTALNFRDEINGKLLTIPRLYSMEDKAVFDEIARVTFGILNKVIKEYMEHEDYRKLFPFTKDMEELILLSKGVGTYLPLARLDIFYHEDTGEFKFCEINADGSSGMNADRIMAEMMIHNPAHQEMLYRYDMYSMELFDSWAEEFLRMYEDHKKSIWENVPVMPGNDLSGNTASEKTVRSSDTGQSADRKINVAIIDFLDIGRVREFEEFVRHFQKNGMHCEICDIRKLRYENGMLISENGHRIDAIYRRAVTSEIMDRLDEVPAFLQAVRDRAVFLAGDFCTHIIDNKWTFYVLHHERTAKFLTPEEVSFIKAHIPMTVPFDGSGIDKAKVLENKDAYILKPWDGYAAHGVKAGCECTKQEWESYVNEVYGKGYICQEFAKQYDSYNIDIFFGDGEWKEYSHMTGLFVYNGKFSGVIARSAPSGGIIDYYRDERRQPTFFVM